MYKFLQLSFICGLVLAITSCGARDNPKNSPKMAKAIVQPIKGKIVSGIVWFTETKDGVEISADFYGLTPGKHGFHVHEFGDCSSHDGSSAGAHYNPTKKKHGGPDNSERHIGDFGNIEANENGHAHYKRVDRVIQLSGEHSIIGKSIIIHQDEDDLASQPAGNAGARIGCGMIELINP